MALAKCPDCGRDISTAAPNCPQCGRPMAMLSGKAVHTQRKGGKYEGVGFLVILAGIGTCFVSGGVGGILIFMGFVVFLIGRFM
jgi:predicted amidophosphoribosyltransferase